MDSIENTASSSFSIVVWRFKRGSYLAMACMFVEAGAYSVAVA
jgi:hypothetical protein